MNISRMTKIAAILAGAASTLVAIVPAAYATNDPTSGRIQQRQAQARAQYHECAGFALRVYNAALEQAGGNSAKVRAARSHYQGNLSRCRNRYL